MTSNENATLNLNSKNDRTATTGSKKRFFKVLWTKYAPNKKRKNKNFADGFLTYVRLVASQFSWYVLTWPARCAFTRWDQGKAGETILYEDQGKVKSQTKKKISDLAHVFADFSNGDEHDPIPIGGFEVELDAEVSEKDFLSGAAFLSSSSATVSAKPALSFANKGFVNPMGGVKKGFVPPMTRGAAVGALPSLGNGQKRVKRFTPAYDPNGDSALVLNRDAWYVSNLPGYVCPDSHSGARMFAREADKEGICPVVLDPSLYKKMRPHQKEGVQFLYKCVTESVVVQRGAILADDMGLGKSLQTIALLETLLKQGPQGVPIVKKALVVAPSSLLDNWRAEIRKWVGEASTVKAIILGASSSAMSKQEQEKKQTILDFKFGRLYNIGIISYETLRKYAGELSGSIDILVADEGHRIKSASGNKTIDALVLASKNSRRVLLSGTPLQNNLSELYAMCDYVRPGMLGTYASFQNVFAGPIEKSRDKNAKEEVRVLGAARLEELKNMLAPFMLRRSAEVNRAYLPRLSSYAVFCRPSDRQVSMIKEILLRRWHSDMYVGDEALVLLGELRKVCGHPVLLDGEEAPRGAEESGACSATPAGSISAVDDRNASESSEASDAAASGKMETALGLIDRIVSGMGERVVMVSQWTSMLSVLESAIKKRGFSTTRLDGSTPVAKRQDIVNAFNNNGIGQVFLLSTQAGGVGLNLIGANRLILYDSHWNPALDSQAMARIWRDGQTKQCYIYRMITAGTVEEKIYQRQMVKGQLARCCVMAESTTLEAANAPKGKKEGGSFTKEELKELFKIKVGVSCMTADQLQSSGTTYVDDKDAKDSVIREVRRGGLPISFVFNERAQDERGKIVEDAAVVAEGDGAPESAEEVANALSDGDLDVLDDF